MKLGIDIGSVAAKVVVLDAADNIIETRYTRTKGQPIETIFTVLEEILARHSPDQFRVAAATGTGGDLVARLLGIPFVNEITAQAAATARFHPAVKTILEIGGEDSKLIILGKESRGTTIKVTDFAINGACAAGTGSFLDQQASRMGIPIEQFGDIALRSEHPPRVAGRCSVFAKTDMIHLQQVGTPVQDIIAGLCFAMVRNFKGQVIRGRNLSTPVSFQGGVAANKGIRRAILEVLQLGEAELIIPEHFAVLGALGAALVAGNRVGGEGAEEGLPKDSLQKIRDYITHRKYEFVTLPALEGDNYPISIEPAAISESQSVEAYVGVDIGSISTNVVVIDRENNVLARRYLMTAGQPIEAVKRGLNEVGQEVGDRVVVKGAGSTGSGRYMTGEFFGADVIRNEITSHAKAASFMYPEVDTIFEIGGQDAKYISLQNGTIVDFAMNKVCAAGTGSFLEEQAEKLGISIKEEFGAMALSSTQPLDLGERCTVFMESQLNFYKQRGAAKKELVAGLAYSVVKNYLTKVVEHRLIGDHILFQGGTAFNRAVKAAFESVLGKKVQVPPHHDILGAIGVAMLAKEEVETNDRPSRFLGFNLSSRQYELSSFECQRCSNRCEVHKVVFGAEKPLFYGSRCGLWDSPEKKEQRQSSLIPRLFDERQEALINTYSKESPDNPNGKTVGIPRALFFHELFPLWQAFFTEMGFQVVVSDPTNQHIMRQGVENIIEEPCLPIKLAHGHVLNLLEKGPDFLFLPVQCTMEKLSNDFAKSWNCPLTQSLPYILFSSERVKEALTTNSGSNPARVVRPVIHPDRGRPWLGRTLKRVAREMGMSSIARIDKAIQAGFAAFDAFNAWQQKRGREILTQLGPDEKAIVIIGRAYNTYDPGMTLNLPEKLRDLGMLAIPLDFLPIESIANEVSIAHPNMYWKSGQKILGAARIIARDPRLFGLYVTNFACGPDSYLLRFFSRETEGKPFLTIEIDEHSADAGIITRCEAFVDTIRNASTSGTSVPIPMISISSDHTNRRRIYIPYMIDHGYVTAAAMRHCGADAEPLPESDELTLDLGRKYTTGKECFPSIITTGDIVKKTLAADFDADHAAFFMPAASGPCRFGQYNRLHRLILDELGLHQVPILVFDQTKGYHNDISALGRGFRLHTWRALTVLDSMQKILLEKRPYEVNRGTADAIYQELLDELVGLVGQDSNTLKAFSRRVRDAFNALAIDRDTPRPRIGLVGEIFVRSNQFANDFLVRKLEALGAQCGVPPLEEWLDYIDYQRKRRNRLHIEGGWRDWAKQKLTEIVQEGVAEPLRKQFDGSIEKFPRELPTQEILSRGRAYLTPAVEGEAILSMGRVVEYAENGFDGIVNIIPFGCMPGTIVSLLLHQFRHDHGLPFLNVVVEGTKDTSQSVRLDAFYHQCCEHMQRRRGTGRN